VPLWQAYADAHILAHKELIAGRIVPLPLIAWIYEAPRQTDNGRFAWERFLDGSRPISETG
jgi:hypothetical protein